MKRTIFYIGIGVAILGALALSVAAGAAAATSKGVTTAGGIAVFGVIVALWGIVIAFAFSDIDW